MGVFNQTCFLSGKTIVKNEEAAVFILQPAKYQRRAGTGLIAASLPICGKYDEYGTVKASLKNYPELINTVNRLLHKKKNRFKTTFKPLKKDSPDNYFWGGVFDYELPVCYLSKTLYDQLPDLVLKAGEAEVIKKDCADLRKRLEKNYDLKTVKKNKDLFKALQGMEKLMDSGFGLQGSKLGRLCAYEQTFIAYEGLKESILNHKDEEVVKFYALATLMDAMGQGFSRAEYGTQENNKTLVLKFHELVLKSFKS